MPLRAALTYPVVVIRPTERTVMLRRLLLLAVLVSAVAAAASDTAPPPFAPARLEGEKGAYLIGPVTREAWLAFDPDLSQEIADYEPSPDLVKALSYLRRDVTVTVVLGTWCSDSRREVPRFWKLLDQADMQGVTLVMLAVGRADAPEAAAWEQEHGVTPGYRARFDVELVPTFIVTEDGKELGRIIETPEVSLEADLAGILGVRATPAWH